MNSSLLFLSEQDFSIQQGKKGYLLCNNLPGISLVLFFSNKCQHCNEVFPVFKVLSQQIHGCKFVLINVSNNQNVARMSQKTIAPITHVPFIVLHVNGRPLMKYNGEKSVQAIGDFVSQVLSQIQDKRNFSSTTKIDYGEASIPQYAAGIPFNLVCDEEQCYLTFSEAYKDRQGNGR